MGHKHLKVTSGNGPTMHRAKGREMPFGQRERSGDMLGTDAWRRMAGKWHLLVFSMSGAIWTPFSVHTEEAL